MQKTCLKFKVRFFSILLVKYGASRRKMHRNFKPGYFSRFFKSKWLKSIKLMSEVQRFQKMCILSSNMVFSSFLTKSPKKPSFLLKFPHFSAILFIFQWISYQIFITLHQTRRTGTNASVIDTASNSVVLVHSTHQIASGNGKLLIYWFFLDRTAHKTFFANTPRQI